MGQGVRSGQGRSHGVLQGPEGVQSHAGAVLARRAAARPQRGYCRGRCQLHQEEARVQSQTERRCGVPAAGARRRRDGAVAGGAARALGCARAALAHAARARQHGAQAPLLLHAQEELSVRGVVPPPPPRRGHDACYVSFATDVH